MKENKTDEIIRQIISPESLESLNSLKHINKAKAETLQSTLLQAFYQINRPLTHEEYLSIVDSLEQRQDKPTVNFKRKNVSDLDLEDI